MLVRVRDSVRVRVRVRVRAGGGQVGLQGGVVTMMDWEGVSRRTTIAEVHRLIEASLSIFTSLGILISSKFQQWWMSPLWQLRDPD